MLPGAETWTDGLDVTWEVTGPGRHGEGLSHPAQGLSIAVGG